MQGVFLLVPTPWVLITRSVLLALVIPSTTRAGFSPSFEQVTRL